MVVPGQLVYFPENVERGPCAVHEVDPSSGRITLEILKTGALVVAPGVGALHPYPLPRGLKVWVFTPTGQQDAVVLRSTAPVSGELRTVHVEVGGEEREVQEFYLRPSLAKSIHPVERLRALEWDYPKAFHRRRNLLLEHNTWLEDAEGLLTLTGARVEPFGHQIYAMRRVLFDHAPRFILADEVGLGKTVEAGLVLQAMMTDRPQLRVLVITPGVMTRQWLCELYLRFGSRAFRLCESLEQLSGERVIVSASVLLREQGQWQSLLESKWDMVVIDEAHQFPPGHALYELFRELSKQTPGILVLSATPSQRQVQGLLGLLALVSPDQYDPEHPEKLEGLLEGRRGIWDRLAYMQSFREGGDFDEMLSDPKAMDDIAFEWEELAEEDEHLQGLLERLRSLDGDAFGELQLYVQENYRVDQRLLRTRRRTLSDQGHVFNERVYRSVSYEASLEERRAIEHFEEHLSLAAQGSPEHLALFVLYFQMLVGTPQTCLERLLVRQKALEKGVWEHQREWFEELLLDPSPQERDALVWDMLKSIPPFDGEATWLEHAIGLTQEWEDALGGRPCARHAAAIEQIVELLADKPDAKFLAFEVERDSLTLFAEHLRDALPPENHIEVFHWTDSPFEEVAMNDASIRFQRKSDRRVLVSDELGGEGRNFQMADSIIHITSNWAVSRMEQRIGRLDRMSREADYPVESILIEGPSQVERLLNRIHAEAFEVFERSIAGLEFLLPDLQRAIFEMGARGPDVLERGLEEVKGQVENAGVEVNEDLDLALDVTRGELDEALETQDLLRSFTGEERADPMISWAKGFNIRVRDSGTEGVRFRWSPNQLRAPLPGYPLEGEQKFEINGTFDREHALEREDLQFFGPGHQLFDALLLAAEEGAYGNMTVMGRNLGRTARGRIHLLILLRHSLDPESWPIQDISPGLLTRARRYLMDQTIEVGLSLDEEYSPVVLEHGDEVLERLLLDWQGRDEDLLVSTTSLTEYFELDRLCEGIEASLERSLDVASEEREPFIEEALESLSEAFLPEISYFRSQLARGVEGDWEKFIKERETILSHLREERVYPAGIAVVIGR